MIKSTLDYQVRIGFAFGHIFNDLCVSIWFSYGLLFYKFYFLEHGYLFIVFGQVIDAFATIFFGIMLDNTNHEKQCTYLGKYFQNQYLTNYIVGTLLSFISFPYEISELKFILTEYKILVISLTIFAIFIAQIGWTIVQLTHLSLINRLSSNSSDRIWLTSSRQAASIYSSLIVYILFWFTLSGTNVTHLSISDVNVFANNSFFITIIGIIHCSVFLVAIHEKLTSTNASRITDDRIINDQIKQPKRSMDSYSKKDWFKDPIFYRVSFIYMLSRVYMNISMAYTPLYLQKTLYLEKTSIAFIPLLIYISGMIMSFLSNYIENHFGNKIHMSLGIILALTSSIWIIFGSRSNESYLNWQIYIIAIQIGLSITIIKISSISLVAEMIGFNHKCASFVYGMVSFFEKIAVSFLIMLIEQFNYNMANEIIENDHNEKEQNINYYYQYIMSYVIIIIIVLILIGLLTISNVNFKK